MWYPTEMKTWTEDYWRTVHTWKAWKYYPALFGCLLHFIDVLLKVQRNDIAGRITKIANDTETLEELEAGIFDLVDELKK